MLFPNTLAVDRHFGHVTFFCPKCQSRNMHTTGIIPGAPKTNAWYRSQRVEVTSTSVYLSCSWGGGW